MCIEVMVIRDGEEFDCTNVGQLADALQLVPMQVSSDPREFCLCGAYLDKLGAREATEAEGWPFPQYVIEVKGGANANQT